MRCCVFSPEEKQSLLGDKADGKRQVHPGANQETCDQTHQPIFPSYRLLVCMIAFLGACCAFGSQALVGASLLLMIRHDDDAIVNVTTSLGSSTEVSHGDGWNSSNNHDGVNDEWHYTWDKSSRGWVTSSYFVGYYVMQVPTGWLTGRCGGQRLILRSSAINVLCQALAIWVPRLGPYQFSALLFLSGMANACSFPALFAVTAKWCPPSESSRLMTIVFSGVSIGNAMVYCVSAFTSRISMMGGWPFNFVFMIVMQIIFLSLWAILVTNSPEENKFVKPAEVIYISTHVRSETQTQPKKHTPWAKMLTSPPVYALAASLYGGDFLTYGMMTIFPEYFVTVRGMSNSVVSILSGVPWLLCPLASYLVSQAVDVIRHRQWVRTSILRKAADVIAKPVAGLLLLVLSLLPVDHVTLPSILYALSIVILMAFQGCTWPANLPELTPDYAGEVLIIAQLFSMTGPFMAPPVFAALTPHNSAGEWQLCFAISLALCVLTSLVFLALGSTHRQHWDQPHTHTPRRHHSTHSDGDPSSAGETEGHSDDSRKAYKHGEVSRDAYRHGEVSREANDVSRDANKYGDVSRDGNRHTDVSRDANRHGDVSRDDNRKGDVSKGANDVSREANKHADVSREANKHAGVSKEANRHTDVSRDKDKHAVLSEDTENCSVISEDIEKYAFISEDIEKCAVISEDIEKYAVISEDTKNSAVMSKDAEKYASISERYAGRSGESEKYIANSENYERQADIPENIEKHVRR